MTDTFTAFVRFKDDRPDIRWTGLTRGQAVWRYHWIRRNRNPLFFDFKEYGYRAEKA